VGVELFRTHGRTETQDMTQLTVDICNFAKANKKEKERYKTIKEKIELNI
jgi:hypothetical protein